MNPDTIEALNNLIRRSYDTVRNSHAWTATDHAILEATIKAVEIDSATPARQEGWRPARERGVSMRGFRRFGWETRRR